MAGAERYARVADVARLVHAATRPGLDYAGLSRTLMEASKAIDAIDAADALIIERLADRGGLDSTGKVK